MSQTTHSKFIIAHRPFKESVHAKPSATIRSKWCAPRVVSPHSDYFYIRTRAQENCKRKVFHSYNIAWIDANKDATYYGVTPPTSEISAASFSRATFVPPGIFKGETHGNSDLYRCLFKCWGTVGLMDFYAEFMQARCFCSETDVKGDNGGWYMLCKFLKLNCMHRDTRHNMQITYNDPLSAYSVIRLNPVNFLSKWHTQWVLTMSNVFANKSLLKLSFDSCQSTSIIISKWVWYLAF